MSWLRTKVARSSRAGRIIETNSLEAAVGGLFHLVPHSGATLRFTHCADLWQSHARPTIAERRTNAQQPGQEGQGIDRKREDNPAEQADAKDAEDDSDDEHGGASVTRSGRA
jgi:hypothetical protein